MTTLTSTSTHTNTLMQTALVTASGPIKRCQTRILIDTGSQKTFITQCLKDKLQLKAAQKEILDVTWDKELPDSFKENWLKWLNELQSLTPLEIPRQYFNNVVSEVELHVFCDSSQLAYGAVAYLRGSTPKSETQCAFVMSRSKVAPIKPQTMPRLELLAAVLGAELSKYLSNTLLPKFYKSQIILWSDSQIVLSWISS